ncbi:MAG: tetratricopeptide repeat protein [Luteolibacter sp.]|jgi:tetratricopeptide (TPR) repeat protein
MPLVTEKELSDKYRKFWLKALTAVQTENPGYAIPLIQPILEEYPEFLEGRKMLRKCELLVTGGEKKRGIFGLNTSGMSAMKFHSQAKKDPAGTLPVIEKELEKDPANDTLNELLHDICVRLGYLETAAFALETVRNTSPENAKLLHKLAEFYLAQNDPTKAYEVYTFIIKHHPTDGKAIKGAKDASARASMQKQKWDENSDMRSLLRDAEESAAIEKASRTGLTREQLKERRNEAIDKYSADPNNLATAKELAGIYEQLEDWHNAQTFFEWAHSLSNGDVALANKAAVMKDLALESDLTMLESALAEDPENEELRAQLEARRQDRRQEKVTEAKQRVEQNPTDPQLRYELGRALYDSGDYSAAIPHLQQATRNPHIRTKVLLLLARAFKAKSMFDLAVKQLTDALADLSTMDATKKEILYEKGITHHDMGDAVAALDCFKQIYEVDYGYRDVAQRVESSYGS